MPDGVAETAASGQVELGESIPGELGAASIGVMGIARDAREARLSLGWRAKGIGWSSSLVLREGSLVPTPGQVFRVSAIVGAQGGHRAKVVFTPAGDTPPGVAASADAMVLAAGDGSHAGGMRFGDRAHTTSMIVTAWEPSEAAPAAVTIEWWPSDDVRAYADPASVHSIRATVGSRIEVPQGSLSVLAVEGTTPAHGARVILRPD